MQPITSAGVDEAGRGSLVGPVVVASVILPENFSQPLADSKKLSQKQRERLFTIIKQQAISWSIIEINEKIIDEINILQATLLGMKISLESLAVQPSKALIDGNIIPKNLFCKAEPIVGGDGLIASIQAASILAKVHRDRLLTHLGTIYPQYNFKTHKGYGTKEHRDLIQKYGISEIHRKTFCKKYY